MKWILFTGTWRLTNDIVEADVRQTVRDVIACGDGVLTGGATGVDYFAMDEAMRVDPSGEHLFVIIPANIETYIEDYRSNQCLPPITLRDINNLNRLLIDIKKAFPAHLIEMPYNAITEEQYNLRDAEEIRHADEVYAFHVNNSPGTQDTIIRAIRSGVKVSLHKKYSI